jgi:uncharacterized protein YjiS (DUF1127 family)
MDSVKSGQTMHLLERRLVGAGPIIDAIGRLIAAIRSGRRVARDVAYLRSLDDRMLDDIGLSRAEIDDGARYGRMQMSACAPFASAIR